MFKLLLFSALLKSHYAMAIQVIGLTENSQIIQEEISTANYIKILKTLKESLDHQIASRMKLEQNENQKWRLEKFSVGLGLNGEIGIGPYKFGKAIKQRFIFTR